MTLEVRREAARRATATSGGPTEEDLVVFVLPGCLHAIQSLDLQVHVIPCICVASGCTVVIMTWNLDVTKAQPFGRREDRIQNGNGSPVREEMALQNMSRWVVTERELSGNFRGESEIGTGKRLGWVDVIGRAVKTLSPLRAHNSPGWRVWGAYATIRLPDTAVPPPVWNGKVAHSVS